MTWSNSRQAYGWAAIGLHWISAIGVIVLYLLGERMEDAATRAEKLAFEHTHVSVAVLLFTFLAARLMWSLSQPHPASYERNPWLRRISVGVHVLFMAMIAILLATGPLSIWSAPRPIPLFDLLVIPSPFPTRVEWLHEGAETVHALASNLFWPLLALHLAGALKHLLIDRDPTLQRMLWVKRA